MLIVITTMIDDTNDDGGHGSGRNNRVDDVTSYSIMAGGDDRLTGCLATVIMT